MLAMVTGANGLIGANLCRALIRHGYRVRALVRRSSDITLIQGWPIELVHGDILEPHTLVRAAAGCDVIFHTAAIFAYSGVEKDQLMTTAVDGVSNTLIAAKAAQVRRVVLTSSSVVFGSSERAVVRTEADTLSPYGVPDYFVSKYKQEQTALALARELEMDMVVVNPCITVGAYDAKLSPSNAIIIAYLSDPFRTTYPGGCNVVSARDVAEGHVLAAERGGRGECYLLGSENLEWSLVHRMVAELCGVPAPSVYANHTTSLLAATVHELWAQWTGMKPLTTRAQAKTVGQFFWYSHRKAAVEIGYAPRPAREALAEAIAFLVRSRHMSAKLRRSLALSKEVYDAQISLSRETYVEATR